MRFDLNAMSARCVSLFASADRAAYQSAVPVTTAVVAALAILAIPEAAHAQIVIDNPGNSVSFAWGNPASPSLGDDTWGQVVAAPTGSVRLSDFTFTIAQTSSSGSTSTASIPFRAFVYAWDSANNRATGPALFTSAPLATGTTFPLPITINTGNTVVTAGSQYVLAISSSGLQAGAANTIYGLRFDSGNHYSGGQLVRQSTGNNPAVLTTAAWTPLASGNDLQFTATFNAAITAAPEPGSLALLAFTLTAGAGIAIRKRRNRA